MLKGLVNGPQRKKIFAEIPYDPFQIVLLCGIMARNASGLAPFSVHLVVMRRPSHHRNMLLHLQEASFCQFPSVTAESADRSRTSQASCSRVIHLERDGHERYGQ
jgi:hypothetical protein